MRSTRRLTLLTAMTTVAAAALSMSCEETATDSTLPPAPTTTVTAGSSGGTPATRRLPTTEEIFGTATRPATRATASAASNDPLATPQSTIAHMFELMQKQDVTGVRAIMADPLPADQLRGHISTIAQRLNSGAKWQIIDTHTDGVAAMVIFRTTFPDGREEIEPLPMINRYDRWKVMLGPMNVRKYTPGEMQSMTKTMTWAAKRVDELRGVTTTQSTTAPARRRE